ncbi:MAG: hypothetical protein U0354_17490 [Candidatus Sericytochromatia bacterium]
MINNKAKRGLLVVLGLIITSCSTSINSIQKIKSSNSLNSDSKTTNEMRVSDKNVRTFLTNEEFESLKKEYSGFKTLALSYEYLYRKVQKLLTYTDNGLYLTREIEFARVIHPSLLLQIYCDHPELYSASIIKPKVIERKTNDSIFNDYLVQLSCGANSGGGGSSGNEIQVSSSTNTHFNSKVAIDNDGDFVITWMSNSQDGDGYGIYGQRFNSNGTKNGSEFQVNTYTTGSQINSSVSMNGTGNFIVTWQSEFQDSNSSGIFAQRYNSDGTPNGSEFQVNSYTTGYQGSPSVKINDNGDFVITWESNFQDGDSTGVYAQRYNSDGTPNGSEFRVNTYTTDYQSSPSVTINNSGNFIITWLSHYQDGDSDGIFAQRFNSNGTPNGSEFQINTYTTNYQVSPSISMLNSGNFVITWNSYNQDGDSSGVFAQRFNSNGIMQGSEFQVNTYTANEQNFPSISTDELGNFAITWLSYGQDSNGVGVHGQRYNSNGMPQGSEFRIDSDSIGVARGYSNIAMNINGNFVVTWVSLLSNADVYAKRYDSNGNEL